MRHTWTLTSAIALGLLFSAAAHGEEVQEMHVAACTKDGKTAALEVTLGGSVRGADLKQIVREAFVRTAHSMDSADMLVVQDDGINQGVTSFLDRVFAVLAHKHVSKDILVGAGNHPPLTITQGCSLK